MDAGHHEDLPQPGDTQRHVHLATTSEMEGVQGHLSGRFTYGLGEERKRYNNKGLSFILYHICRPSKMEGVQGHLSGGFTYGLEDERNR